jgi:DNA-binding transcriptional MerR regulator
MTSRAEAVSVDRERWRYRMKDLCEASGLPRQAIHFYIQQGLLPAGRKTGRNMAWYSEEHLERLHLIKKLQHERFLPLKAIKALFDGEEDVFSARQHAFLAGVKARLGASLTSDEGRLRTVPATQVAEQSGLKSEDVERALELGLVGGTRKDGEVQIAAADTWIFELFGEVQELGFSEELGFSVEDLGVYQDLVNRLLQEEVHFLSSRLTELPPEQVAKMVEAVIPIIDRYIVRLHASKIRDFFSNVL